MIAQLAVALALTTDYSSARFSQAIHETAPLAARGVVEIDDRYGDVHVSAGGAGTVDISAVKQADTQADLAATTVHVDAVEGAVKITTDFPADDSLFHNRGRSVDYDVRVPPGTKVVLVLQYGDGTVSHVGGPVDATSRYGDVKATGASGAETLTTEYGDVKLSLTAIEASQSVTMKTTYGDVDLTLPAGATPHVSAKTRFGDIDDDFDSTTVPGPSIDLVTTFGDVTVRKDTR
jgi:hypothetical protein